MKNRTKLSRTSRKSPKGSARKPAAKKAAAPKGAAKRARPAAPAKARDPRLPAVGEVIVKRWHDRDLKVTVLEAGFEFEGRPYGSLSAIARELLKGSQVNGFLFFGLIKRPGKEKAAAAAPASS